MIGRSSIAVVALALALVACGGAETRSEPPEPPPRPSRTDPSAVAALAMPLPPAGYHASALAIGGGHVCALREAGAVECWGRNEYGELGDGTTTHRDTPAPVIALPPVVEIRAGTVHTCARTDEGAVYCWGDGDLGEIGDGARERRSQPTRVVGIAAYALASTSFMTCARVDAAGALRCWGSFPSPDPADVASGLTHAAPIAVPVASLDVPQLAGDAQRACALDRSGATWCWGLSDASDVVVPPLTAPAIASAIAPAGELAFAGSFVCAAHASGVSCWGVGASAVLGIATASPSTPAMIARMPGNAHIAAGESFVCAAAGGETRCAGWGELVDASGGIWPLGPAARLIPALGNARTLVARGSLVCAIAAGGAVSCMGYRTGVTDVAPPS